MEKKLQWLSSKDVKNLNRISKITHIIQKSNNKKKDFSKCEY